MEAALTVTMPEGGEGCVVTEDFDVS